MYKAVSCILIFFLILAFTTPSTDGCGYCVANPTASPQLVQTKLDYACGVKPESCAQIQPGAPCYVPDDVKKTASYVFNEWYLQGSECNFEGAEVPTALDPSHDNCKFQCR